MISVSVHDPVQDVPTSLTVAGSAAQPAGTVVYARRAGGAPCAPTAQSESGATIAGGPTGTTFSGAFGYSANWTPGPPGEYLVCSYLFATWSDAPLAVASQTIAVRAPRGSIRVRLSPATPVAGNAFIVTFTGTSEATRRLFAKLDPAGAACALTPGADSGVPLDYKPPPNQGEYVQPYALTREAGTYQLCAWLAARPDDTAPVARLERSIRVVSATIVCAWTSDATGQPQRNFSTRTPRIEFHFCFGPYTPARDTVVWTYRGKVVWRGSDYTNGYRIWHWWIVRDVFAHRLGAWQVAVYVGGRRLKARAFIVHQ
jgi:hypothetical protein